MRISDWSSDVCSSDLLAVGGGVAQAEALALADGESVHALVATEHRAVGIDQRTGPDTDLGAEAGVGIAGGDEAEIGRASCRASVCQSVETSAVHGTLKNKHKTHSQQPNIPSTH